MPAAVPAILLSKRSSPRTVVFAFLGSPCVPAHRLDTALDFRSGVGPMRVDGATNPELIQQQGARLDPVADANCQRVTLTGINNPTVAELRKWDGSHVHF